MSSIFRVLALVIGLVCVAAVGGWGGGVVPSDPASEQAKPAPWYEREIRAFEAADEAAMPDPGGVLFVGSSSIRMWKTLAEDMAPLRVISRGFGGSKTGEVLAVFDRIVLPYEPRVIVYYCGDNDLGTENTDSEAAAEGFKAFARRARAEWPEVRIVYIPIKASLARWKNWDAMRKANEIIRAYCERTPGIVFVDTVTPTLTDEGTPEPTMFLGDGLHLSERGYEVWTEAVRPAVLEAWKQATQ